MPKIIPKPQIMEYLGLMSSELNHTNYDRAYIVKIIGLLYFVNSGVMTGN